MNKKAELQVMETIMVVIIIVVLILVGMIFFYRYMNAGIDQDNLDYQKKVFDNSLFTFPNLAEVSCSQGGNKESCLDAYKVYGFSQAVLKKKDYYIRIYGFKNITLKIVYPQKANVLCSSSTINDCSVYNIYSNVPGNAGHSKRVKTTPVSVYLPQEKKYAIGILTITGYNIGV